MSRAQKQRRRAKGAGATTERKPVAIGDARVTKRSGTERPDPATHAPTDIADSQARVIKTRS